MRADGSIGWMNIGITFVRGTADGDPDYLVAVGADVTDQYLHQAELHHQARHDPPPGLPNRTHLTETVNRHGATAENGALAGLCFLDLNRFEQINDRFGHTVGDRVLRAIAARLMPPACRAPAPSSNWRGSSPGRCCDLLAARSRRIARP